MYICVIDKQLLGQDGWILAKFFFCVSMDRDEFIIWLSGKFFLRDTAGSPEGGKEGGKYGLGLKRNWAFSFLLIKSPENPEIVEFPKSETFK